MQSYSLVKLTNQLKVDENAWELAVKHDYQFSSSHDLVWLGINKKKQWVWTLSYEDKELMKYI
jgi:hypothetical protein